MDPRLSLILGATEVEISQQAFDTISFTLEPETLHDVADAAIVLLIAATHIVHVDDVPDVIGQDCTVEDVAFFISERLL